MAWTQTQLDDLEAAYAQGLSSVSIAGKTIAYRSRAEMRAMIDEARRELGLATADKRKRVTFGVFRRDK